MITGINGSETIKYNLCICKWKFDGRKCNLNQKWNEEKSQCECKNPIKNCVCKKDWIWNPRTCCASEIDKYLTSIIGDSGVAFDEIIKFVAKSYDELTNFIKNWQPVK